MQILALSRRRPGTTPEGLAPWAEAEAARAFELMAAGVVRSVHMCPERPGSILVLECAGLDEARDVLGTLPMVREGLIEFELSRMLPYTGLRALFAEAHRGLAA